MSDGRVMHRHVDDIPCKMDGSSPSYEEMLDEALLDLKHPPEQALKTHKILKLSLNIHLGSDIHLVV